MKTENQNKLNVVVAYATIIGAIATVIGVIIAISILP
jgi:CHASE3 domain sensor protein